MQAIEVYRGLKTLARHPEAVKFYQEHQEVLEAEVLSDPQALSKPPSQGTLELVSRADYNTLVAKVQGQLDVHQVWLQSLENRVDRMETNRVESEPFDHAKWIFVGASTLIVFLVCGLMAKALFHVPRTYWVTERVQTRTCTFLVFDCQTREIERQVPRQY